MRLPSKNLYRLVQSLILALGVAWSVGSALGKTPNGNDLALYLTEAKTDQARKALVDEAMGKQHFFRYLRIETLQEGETNGYPYIYLSMNEPSSYTTVQCTVRKSVSLAKLLEDPVTKVGDCVALTGVVAGIDVEKRLILLNPVIVRYKDIPAPKVGKELLAERDSSAVIYSYTGGKNPVNVTKRDEDLVQNEEAMIKKLGKDGWSRYLLEEIAKRDKAAKAERDKLNIYRKKPAAPDTNAPPNMASPITEDDDE